MITPKTYTATQCLFVLLSFLLVNIGCKKDLGSDPVSSSSQEVSKAFNGKAGGKDFLATNLVADVHKYHPQFIDPNLVNAWGIAFGPTGGIWVSAAEKGLSTIYDKTGKTLRDPVSIPFQKDPRGGNPTGQVYNPTEVFRIPSTGQVSKFIFVTENGTIAAWAGGSNAITVVDRSEDEVVYKGLTMAMYNDSWFLFATDFHNGKVDVYDQNFNYVSDKYGSFRDDDMPAGYAPFNIKSIGEALVVTYAKQLAPNNEDDEAGPGNGYINIFNIDGSLLRRFASRGTLNSPWGIEVMLDGFTNGPEFKTRNILIGNFGDGRINVFDSGGNFLGQLYNHGKAVEIEGLWALSYPPNTPAYSDVLNRLYFTAGPDNEEHGVFGYITSQ